MLSTDESPGRLGPATSTDVLPNSLRKDGVRFCRRSRVDGSTANTFELADASALPRRCQTSQQGGVPKGWRSQLILGIAPRSRGRQVLDDQLEPGSVARAFSTSKRTPRAGAEPVFRRTRYRLRETLGPRDLFLSRSSDTTRGHTSATRCAGAAPSSLARSPSVRSWSREIAATSIVSTWWLSCVSSEYSSTKDFCLILVRYSSRLAAWARSIEPGSTRRRERVRRRTCCCCSAARPPPPCPTLPTPSGFQGG